MNIAPTPWKMGIPINRAVYAADTTPICICDSMGEATVEQEINHARLIAAAPELLAALRALLPYAENEAHALQELRDSEAAEAEAEAAWQAIERAQELIERADANQ